MTMTTGWGWNEVLKQNLIIYMYLKYHNTFNRCRCRHLSRVPPAVLSRNHITSKRLLLTGSLSEPSCSLGRKSTVWLAAFFVFFPQCAAWSQATLCTFLCRHCTIATWKCEHETATSFFFSWTSIQSFRIRLQKNCQHLTNWARWNKRD